VVAESAPTVRCLTGGASASASAASHAGGECTKGWVRSCTAAEALGVRPGFAAEHTRTDRGVGRDAAGRSRRRISWGQRHVAKAALRVTHLRVIVSGMGTLNICPDVDASVFNPGALDGRDGCSSMPALGAMIVIGSMVNVGMLAMDE